jgi:Methyltransferase domain
MLQKAGLKTNSEFLLLKNELSNWRTGFVRPGHYYSPLNDIEYLRKNEQHVFTYECAINDINLRREEQLRLVKDILPYYLQLPFTKQKDKNYRYYYDNPFFSYSDGIFLFCLLNHLKPNRVIEIGSGFSSALMLDTNEHFVDNSINLTFIEPYPEERLNALLKPDDKSRVIRDFIQNVPINLFSELKAGDILFVDSSHVSKFKSDLNHILFNILPELCSGVYIHFHDIFYPFEYPKEWILEGRAWNEIYLLRAFLMNNKEYEIVLFPSMLERFHEDWLKANMPLTLNLHEKWPPGDSFEYYLPHRGQSLWIRKL